MKYNLGTFATLAVGLILLFSVWLYLTASTTKDFEWS